MAARAPVACFGWKRKWRAAHREVLSNLTLDPRRWNRFVVQCLNHLYHGCNPGRTLEMSDVRLYRSKRDAVRRRAFEGTAQFLNLNGIADRRSRSVRLHVTNGFGTKPAGLKGCS